MAEAVSTPYKAIGSAVGFKNIFKTPTPPWAKSPATASSPAVQQAVAEAAARRSKARGFMSTILSQPSTLKSSFGS